MRKFSRLDKPEKKKRKRWLIVPLISVLAVTGVAACIFWPSSNVPQQFIPELIMPEAGGDVSEGHLPGMTDAEVREQMQKEADKSLFSFKVNSRPIFEDGGGAGTLRIENPNHNMYPFTVEIFLDETGEKIYESGGIFPNRHINTAKLGRALPQGEHEATAYINAYDPDTKEFRGKSAVELTLVVKQ